MTLHIYTQSCEHDDAFIVGTRLELMKLRDSIDAALGNKAQGKSSDSLTAHFTADGEGYDLTVKVVPESVKNKLALPYAESIGRELGQDAFCPFTVPTD